MMGFCQEEGGEGSRERLLHQGGRVFLVDLGAGGLVSGIHGLLLPFRRFLCLETSYFFR